MDIAKNNAGTEEDGFSKIAPLFGTAGGEQKPPRGERPTSLEYAPAIVSSEDIARMTTPARAGSPRFGSGEAGDGGFLSEDVVFRGKQKPSARDPFFASRVLEQERGAGKEPNIKKEREPLPSFEAVGAKEDGESVKRIRTYQSDVAGALKKEKTSLIQMVLAEQGRKRDIAEEASPKQPKNLALIIVSLALVLVGASFAGFAAWRYATNQKQAAKDGENLSAIPSLIFAEVKKGMNITDLPKDRIARALSSEIASTAIRLDFVAQIYFTEDVASGAGTPAATEYVQTLVHTSEFFRILESGMPESLARALAQNFFFGIHAFNGNQPFIILRADYFESAFAGMLRWENTMPRDILPLFGIQVTPELVNRPFEDVVIRNQDFRALRDTEGNIVLLYLFHDKSTIIIGTADETIKEAVDRLNRPIG